MRLFEIIFARRPVVWLLLGLPLLLGGLYLGLNYSQSFAYVFVGLGCSFYGLLLFIFRRRERPDSKEARRLSPNFISIGATTVFRSPSSESGTPAEQPDA